MSVGLQGVAIGDRAYQQAVAYAKDRVQSKPCGPAFKDGAVRIIEHADVRRMLMTMRAQVEATRALTYYAALSARPGSKKAPDEQDRHKAAAIRRPADPRGEGRGPPTSGSRSTSLGIQVHGGHGLRRRDRRGPTPSATPASRPSTRARTVFKRTTSLSARRYETAVRPLARSSTTHVASLQRP